MELNSIYRGARSTLAGRVKKKHTEKTSWYKKKRKRDEEEESEKQKESRNEKDKGPRKKRRTDKIGERKEMPEQTKK